MRPATIRPGRAEPAGRRMTMTALLDAKALAEGTARERTVGDRSLVILRVSGGVRAWLNVCPHQGRRLDFAPDQFLFTADGRLVCPHHGACFEPDTGLCTDGPCRGASLSPVDVREIDGVIRLDEPDA